MFLVLVTMRCNVQLSMSKFLKTLVFCPRRKDVILAGIKEVETAQPGLTLICQRS